MKRFTFAISMVALVFAVGCSNKKKECMDACEKTVQTGEANCKGQQGPAADACKQAVKQASDQCKTACENL